MSRSDETTYTRRTTNIQRMSSRLIVILFTVAFACHRTWASDQGETNEVQKTFLYFAYGSNMLTQRIHKNNPSAKPVAIAKLKNHYLDFITYERSWHGCVSTIVPSQGAETWGVVWAIDIADMPNLDGQEGVLDGDYFPKTVSVQTPNGENLECRTYQQTVLPDTYVSPSELPPERQPSPAYLNITVEGAKEHNIPSHYLQFLRSFRRNGYQGQVNYA